uniref:Peptidase A1 domain-containing protein n=1 Tax=Kalanchoe fedtschenkoi TaxID=63787 RepID=A0A7N0VG00_KALFE
MMVLLWSQASPILMGAFLFYAADLDVAFGRDAFDSRISPLQALPVHSSPGPQFNISNMLGQDEARAMSLYSRLGGDKLSQPQSTTVPLKPGLSIGSGNYYVRIGLGTPPKYYTMLMDTGSSFSWLQCLPCQYCHPQSDPMFDPAASRTYKPLSCSSSACSSVGDATLNDPACDFSTGHCIYTASYGDRSYSVGVLSQDVLTLSPSQTLAGFLYGCGGDNDGLFGRAAGLLGLGRHRLSLVSQMSGNSGSVFSYCLPSYGSSFSPHGISGAGGFLSIGKAAVADAARFKYTPMIRNSREPTLYFLKLTGFTVGGQPLGVSAAEYGAPAIIDSGTVISRLPVAVYNSLRQALTKVMTTEFKYKQAPAFSILDTCFITGAKVASRAPPVQMLFAGG